MEGLTGPTVKLTLYIKEGRGFGFLQNPIVIVARLCSNTLQTNIYPPVAEPQFHEELLWEVDKQTLRRLRTGKVPVKVECFTLTKQNQRSKVGTVLLDLRSAHIVAKGQSAHAAPDSWHKMQCGSGRCPEMLLCLRVEDMKSEAQACGDVVSQKSPRDSPCKTGRSSPDRSLQSDTLIQVGPVLVAADIFKLTVCAESTEKAAFKTWSDVHFSCHAFGTESKSNPFKGEATSECVISIRSSLHFLRQYLENNPLVWIRLAFRGEEMAATQIDIAGLVPTASVAEFLELHADQNGTLTTEKHSIVAHNPSSPGDLLFSVMAALKHCHSDTNEWNDLTKRERPRLEAAGDGDVTALPVQAAMVEIPPARRESQVNDQTQGPRTDSRLLKACASEPSLVPCDFRAFSLRVELQSLVLHARPCGERLRLALRHPQARAVAEGLAEVEAPPPGAIAALDAACRLTFVSTAEEIGRLLLAFPPTVSVQCASAGRWVTLASAALDTSRLLAERRRVVFPAPLLDAQGVESGVLYVGLDLYDEGTRQARERERLVGPAVLDERVAHEAVEELEEWKERQQERFKAQLLAKEAEHLQQLTADFQRRCQDREQQLGQALSQTRELTERLEQQVAACCQREVAQVQAQAALEARGQQLEQRFQAQVQALRDASTRMEADLLHKARLKENECLELRAGNARLEKENESFRKSLEERDAELLRSHLTRDQTAAILQDMRVLEEKLDVAGRSKAYFKEQWRAVAQELHRLKTDQHALMHSQIRDSKLTVQSLGFQSVLNQEAEELDRDQATLKQLKAELSSAAKPAAFEGSKALQTQEVLRLIDDRDLLLRSRQSNLNDLAVDRLNHRIRSQTSLL